MKFFFLTTLCLPFIGCGSPKQEGAVVREKTVWENTVGWTLGDDWIAVGVIKNRGRLKLHVEISGKEGCGVNDVTLDPSSLIADYLGEARYAFAPLPPKGTSVDCTSPAKDSARLEPQLIDQVLRLDNPTWRGHDPYGAILQPLPKDTPKHHRLITLASRHAIITRVFEDADRIYLVFDVETQRPVGLAVGAGVFADEVSVWSIKAEQVVTKSWIHPLLVDTDDRNWHAKRNVARCLSERIDRNLFTEATDLKRNPVYLQHLLDAIENQNFTAYPEREVRSCSATK